MKRTLAAFLVFSSILIHAAPLDRGPVKASVEKGYLGRYAQVLEDSSATMTVDQVMMSGRFHAADAPVPNLGISSSAFWVRIDIENDTKEGHVLLDLEHAEIEKVDLYLLKDGKATLLGATGQARPISTRDIAQPEFVFSLPISGGETSTVLLRLSSSKQLQVPLKIYTALGFAHAISVKDLRIGIYIGIMLALALYNLFVFISIKDRTYIVYVIYIFLICSAQISFWGIFQYYIYSNNPWLSTKSSIIFTFSSAIAAGEFMKRFIDTSNNAKFLHSGIKYFYMLFGIVLLFYLFMFPSIGYQLAQLAAGLFASYMFITILKVWRRGSRQAVYFLISWSVLLLGILVFTLKDMGILPYNDMTVFIMPVGSAIEGILLSFGLADRINVLRREKELSQAEALSMAKENERMVLDQNVMLERKVTERTKALQESTDHLKKTQSQLVSAEKMASLGQLTAGIAHEINNPLNFISSNIPPLKRDLLELKEVLDAYRQASMDGSDLGAVRALEERIGVDYTVKEVQEILRCIQEGTTRTSEIVRGLRTFSRLDEDDLKPADINEGMRSTVILLGQQLRDAVDVQMDLGELPPVECYPGKLNQVFMNLLNNAAHAVKKRHAESSGQIRITTHLEGESVIISIADNGTGMDEATQQRLFEPFFTTKGVGEGTGLGLSIVQGIIEKHAGSITLQSEMGTGTTFTIILPVRQGGTVSKRA
jgi:signal transduction histidine kinase